MNARVRLDLIIIGGGIAGVVCLHYAKRAGLNVLLLEREASVGGLWARLPSWQDIQQNRYDWTVDGIPIDGEHQPSIHKNILAWVEKFDLGSFIRLNTAVTNAIPVEDGWEVTAGDDCEFYCTHLVAATGLHNKPVIPNPVRTTTSIQEFHSSQFHDPSQLRGKNVAVVGGGASAFDLIDLAFENQAARIDWIYRSLRWMAPTKRPKHLAGDIRWIGKQQMRGTSVDELNRMVNDDLRSRYEGFGLNAILPDFDFDFNHHQLIPGRHRMIANFEKIERYQAQVNRIGESSIELSSGDVIPVDVILWGTGYTIDLSYFKESNLCHVTDAADVVARSGSKILSLDEPNLYFLAPGIAGGKGALAWQYAHASMAIVSYIQGKSTLNSEPILKNLNYFDQIRHLASLDSEYYNPKVWPAKYQALIEDLSDGYALPIPEL